MVLSIATQAERTAIGRLSAIPVVSRCPSTWNLQIQPAGALVRDKSRGMSAQGLDCVKTPRAAIELGL